MKLAFAFNIVAQAAQSSNKVSLNACDGQCNDPLATCTLTDGNVNGFLCKCDALDGFTWNDAADACFDIDECVTGGIGDDICNAGAICENTIGGFHCGCAAGLNQGKTSTMSEKL